MEKVRVSLEKSDQEVWLLKIPEPLASVWADAAEGTQLGEIREPAQDNPRKRSKMEVRADVKLLEEDQKKHKRFVPSRYTVRPLPTDNLTVFAEETATPKSEEGASVEGGSVEVHSAQTLGHVSTRGDCVIQPGPELDLFIKTRSSELGKDKMTKEHHGMTQDELLMQQSLAKTQKRNRVKTRKPKGEVKQMLFDLFRKHEFYTLDQLSQLTQQPSQYLASVLHTIAVREQSGEHRNKWHLRRAFRDHD